MKQKDVLVIVTVAIVSGILSFVISSFLFGGSKSYKLTAPKIEPISSEFKLPDEQYFNKQSLNPTKDITIGDSSNNTPFNTTTR